MTHALALAEDIQSGRRNMTPAEARLVVAALRLAESEHALLLFYATADSEDEAEDEARELVFHEARNSALTAFRAAREEASK